MLADGGTTTIKNLRNASPSDKASHSHRPEVSATLLVSQCCSWKPKFPGACHYVDLCIPTDASEEFAAYSSEQS